MTTTTTINRADSPATGDTIRLTAAMHTEPPAGAVLLADASKLHPLDFSITDELHPDGYPRNTIFGSVSDDQPYDNGWEFLQMNLKRANIDVDRVKNGVAPLLWQHYRSDMIGRVERLWLAGGTLYFEAVFAPSALAQEVYTNIRLGILRGISLGSHPAQVKEVRARTDTEMAIYEVVMWEFAEASVVSMPANDRVGVDGFTAAQFAEKLSANFREDTMGLIAGQDADPEQTIAAGDAGATPAAADPTPPAGGGVATAERPAAGDPPVALQASRQDPPVESAEENRVRELVDLGKRFGNKAAAMDAIEAGMAPLDFAKSLGQPAGDPEHKPYVEPKPAPVNAEFSLDRIFDASISPDDPQVRERAANSLRAIEVIRAARREHDKYSYPSMKNGVMVPEELLVAQYNREAKEHNRNVLRAALTTTTTGAGLIDEQLLAQDFIDILIDMTHTVPYCNIMRGLDSTFAIPYTTDAPDTGAYAEGAGPADPSTFAVATRPSTPKRLVCYYEYTPESNVASQMRIGNYGLMEAARVLAEYCETQFWRGTGAGGQVSGLETVINNSRRLSYTAAQPTNKELRKAKTAMNKEKMPMMGRMWVASPDMKAELDFLDQVPDITPLVANNMMFDYPIVESTYPTVRAADVFGVLWLLHAMTIQVAFYGQDVEVIFDRAQKTGAYEATMLKLWDMFPRRPQFGQQVRSG